MYSFLKACLVLMRLCNKLSGLTASLLQ